MVCDNGDNFPSNPNNGQWYLLSKQSLCILYQFTRSKWTPIISFDQLHISIEKTGIDNIKDQKDPQCFTFKTLNFALKNLPPTITADVFIHLYDTTQSIEYVEFISDISCNNNSAIIITGKLKELKSGIQSSSTKGDKELQGSITHFNNVKGYDDKLLYSSVNNQIKLINNVHSDTLFICGIWNKQPSGNYKIYD